MTGHKPFPPVFATNRPATPSSPAETVANEVKRMFAGLLNGLVETPKVALATAYINPQGFELIADELEKAPKVRILLGAEPEEPLRRRLETREKITFSEVAEAHLQGLRRERDLLGFTVEADASARRLVEWLRSAESGTIPRVEVRRFTKGFLHGKAFIVEHPISPAVLAGSSNLTLAGLTWNRELNLGYPSGQHTHLVTEWFDELWDESEPFDLAAEYEERWRPHPPWVVFLRMLYELYGLTSSGSTGPIHIPATGFQTDGIERALRIMGELGGVLVCDEVGLGKTFIAGEIIHRVSQRDRQHVLVVAPASLKQSTWIPFLRRFDLISARVEVVTFDQLRLGKDPAVKPERLDDYSLVVVDEAHNFRNAVALKAEALRDLLTGEHPKKVLLLTATPVNNSLKDLHTLVSYFVRNDAQFAPQGIPSVGKYIAEAQKQDPDTLSPEHLFDLMDKVAVRRTRRFIKREYADDLILNNRGELVPIEFPTPRVKRVSYTLDAAADSLVGKVVHALKVRDDEALVIRSGTNRDLSRLSLARYAPSAYAIGKDIDKGEATNVGLLRSALLKRVESSTAALIATLERLLVSHKAFLDGLDQGLVLAGKALQSFASSEIDSLEEFLTDHDDGSGDQVGNADDFEVGALRTDVEGDVALLQEFLRLARARKQKGADAKAKELLRQLTEIAKEAARPSKDGISSTDRRKIIVFSTYTDTVVDLHERLVEAIEEEPAASPLSAYKGRIAPPIFGSAGGGQQADRAAALAGFCPYTAGELREDGTPVSEDLYDLMVATDVLAEGVNLQQAGHLASFDLPWNPMRLVQRHGRIDRIGSHHKKVVIECFFPAENLDELLHLEETLQRKVAYANAAIGIGGVLPDQVADPNVEVLYHDTQAEIMDLFHEKAVLLEQGGGNIALSGEEYRRRVSKALGDSPFVREQVLGLPYGSGSGFVSQRIRRSGYVFCIRIGEHPEPWFRFVATDPTTWLPLERVVARAADSADDDETVVAATEPWIDSDLLTCLVAADPGADQNREQELPEAASTAVFAAWEVARRHAYDQWTALTDRANLQPQLEKAVRRAVDLVATHGGFLEPTAHAELIGRLSGRWERGIVRSIREIIRREDRSDQEKVVDLQDFVAEAGLQMPEEATPLDPIRPEDIRVVCWMAVSPAKQAL